MKVLAIDTTTFLGSIALVEDSRLVAASQQGIQVTYSERLISSIDHLLEGARWDLSDLDLIVVAKGPGSFTGLRIGLSTAKGLAVALNKPLVGVSSLKALAFGSAMHDGVTVSVIDARREEVYAAAYRFEGGRLIETLIDEGVWPPSELVKKLNESEGKLALVGDGVRRYIDLFNKGLGKKLIEVNDSQHFPHAGYLAMLGREVFEEGGGDDVVSLVPNYLRQSDAEIGLKKSKSG
jgi:tRNA threonylcarbamoyladenosine biosynthesis protein TsaB